MWVIQLTSVPLNSPEWSGQLDVVVQLTSVPLNSPEWSGQLDVVVQLTTVPLNSPEWSGQLDVGRSVDPRACELHRVVWST